LSADAQRSSAHPWTPLGLFVLAFVLRVLPWPNVFVDGRVDFFGADAYYHLRRIAWNHANLPQTLSSDAYLNFPHGAKPIWPPLYDSLLSLLLLPVHLLGGLEAVEHVAVFVPPLLGAATVVALYLLARRHFGHVVATCSAILLSVLSAHVWYSQIGFVDHHAAVALLSTLLLATALDLLREPAAAARGAPIVCGALAGILLLVWPGALLYVAVVLGVQGLDAVAARETDEATRRLRSFALVNGVALLLVAPSGLRASWPQWGEFSPVVLSYFQPSLFATLALWALVASAFLQRESLSASRGKRVAVGAALGAALLALALAALPGLVDGLEDAFRWLFKQEDFQAVVRESQPLFAGPEGPGLRVAEQRLSRFVYVAPLALFAMVQALWRSGHARVGALLLCWCVVLAIVTLLQRRFFNTFSVVLALLMGWSLVRLHELGRARFGTGVGIRVSLLAALVLLAALLLEPVADAYREPLRNQLRWLRGEALRVAAPLASRRRLVEAAQWLRRATPETEGFLDPEPLAEYGLMSDWGDGHVLLYRAQRPTVVGNFGDDLGPENFAASIEYFRAPEAEAVRILDRLRVRYVVARPLSDTSAVGPASMIARFSAPASLGLQRHRLVYESPPSQRSRGGSPELKIFEYVPGAELVGSATPGRRIAARVGFRTNQGRQDVARVSTLADESGRYTLRIPWANRGAPPAVRFAPRTILSAGERQAEIQIDEEQVRRGLRVIGPDLRDEEMRDR